MAAIDANVGKYLLELHRAAGSKAHEEFKLWVYDALQQCLPNDSGFWMRGAISGSPNSDEAHLSVHEHFLYRQPDSLMAEYLGGQMWRDDLMATGILAAPGRAYRQSSAGPWPPRWQAFQRRYGQQQLMSVILMDVESQLFAVFSLYRADVARPFSEEEGERFELLAPHMAEAWCKSWLQERTQSVLSISAFRIGVLVDEDVLTLAQDGFTEALRLEWPNWHGPRLPRELVADPAWAAPDGSWWYGRKVTVNRIRQSGAKTLIRVRAHHLLDTLTVRQREAASYFASGATQSEVAARMKISPSTVNNYLVDVYRILNVTDKAELALLLNRLQH